MSRIIDDIINSSVRDLIRTKPEKKKRNCLRCRKEFISVGQRTCSHCSHVIDSMSLRAEDVTI